MLGGLGAAWPLVDHRGMAAALPEPADETLMLRYVAGDAAAFALLYARHKDGLWRYLLRGSGNEASTAEMFQDVWAGVVRSRASYQPSARFATWLYRLAHNRLIDHWRAAKPHDELDEEAQELTGQEHEMPAARACSRHSPRWHRSSAKPSCCRPKADSRWRTSPPLRASAARR